MSQDEESDDNAEKTLYPTEQLLIPHGALVTDIVASEDSVEFYVPEIDKYFQAKATIKIGSMVSARGFEQFCTVIIEGEIDQAHVDVLPFLIRTNNNESGRFCYKTQTICGHARLLRHRSSSSIATLQLPGDDGIKTLIRNVTPGHDHWNLAEGLLEGFVGSIPHTYSSNY